MRTAALCTALVFTLATSSIHGQRLDAVRAGTMVRIETCELDVFSGPLLNAGADTTRIQTLGHNPPVALPSNTICAYALGARRDRTRGALTGTAVGGGFGLVVLALMKSLGKREGGNELKFGVAAAIISTVLGVSIGTAMAPERWIPQRD